MRLRKALIALGIAAALISSAAAQTAVPPDVDVAQTLMTYKFRSDPHIAAVLQTEARLRRANVPEAARVEIVQRYERQLETALANRPRDLLDPDVQDKFLEITSRATLHTVLVGFLGPLGDLANTSFFQPLADLAKESFSDSAAVQIGRNLGDIAEQVRYSSAVNSDKVAAYVVSTPGMRMSILGRTGIDISQPAATLLTSSPEGMALANYFQSTSNGRSVQQLVTLLSQLDARDEQRKQQLAKELSQLIGLNFEQLNRSIGADIAELGQVLKQRRQQVGTQLDGLTKQVGATQVLLYNFVQSEENRRKEEVRKQQEALAKQRVYADQLAYLQLGTLLLERVDPALAKKVLTVGKATMEIQKAITAYKAVESVAFGSAAQLAVGIANPALAVISVFAATQQPSTDELVLQQLAQLSKQIEDLRKEVSERFDGVDRRLNDVLRESALGFDQLSRSLKINYAAITANLRVGLDTQSLVLATARGIQEQQQIVALGECINVRSALPLMDEGFRSCHAKLADYGTRILEALEVQWSPQAIESRTNSLNAEGSKFDFLKSEFREWSRLPVPSGVVVNPLAWKNALEWYTDFVVRDVQQTNRNRLHLAFDEINERGKRIEEMKASILDSLRQYPAGKEPGKLTTGASRFNAAAWWIDFGATTADQVALNIESAKKQYFGIIGSELNSIEKGFGQLSTDVTLTSSGYQVSEAARQQVMRELPESVRRAVSGGMGTLRVNITHVESPQYQQTCRIDFWGRVFIRRFATHDRYKANFFFDPSPGVFAGSEAAPLKVGEIDFRYPVNGGNILTHDCELQREPSSGPFYCQRADCMGEALISGRLTALQLTPLASRRFEGRWLFHRDEIAKRAMDGIRLEDRSKEVAYYNALMAAMLRFATPEALVRQQGLLLISQQRAGLPAPEAFVAEIDRRRNAGDTSALDLVWRMEKFIRDEVMALHDYLATGVLERAVALEAADPTPQFGIARARTAALYVQGTVATPPPPTVAGGGPAPLPPPPPPPAVSTSGGGGGGCFIATAAYGSEWDKRVVRLRRWRDDVLLQSDFGVSFVRWYYEVSPPIADYIRGSEALKAVTRGLLMPIVFLVSWWKEALVGLIALFAGLVVSWRRPEHQQRG